MLLDDLTEDWGFLLRQEDVLRSQLSSQLEEKHKTICHNSWPAVGNREETHVTRRGLCQLGLPTSTVFFHGGTQRRQGTQRSHRAADLTSAPRATRVSMRTAVSTVMCRQPAIRAPFSGLDAEYSSRMRIKPGISFSAMSRAFRPQAASPMSAAGTRWQVT